jgi:hypothetical protein
MPSWQAPQDLRLGIWLKLLAVVASLPPWQVVHIFWPSPSLEKPLLLNASPA